MAHFLRRAQQKPVVATAGANATKADKRLEHDLRKDLDASLVKHLEAKAETTRTVNLIALKGSARICTLLLSEIWMVRKLLLGYCLPVFKHELVINSSTLIIPINPPSLRELKVVIKPVEPSIWAGCGEFWFQFTFKDDYPDVPPVCRYMGPRRIWHPNIEGDEGKQDWGVCLAAASKDYYPAMRIHDLILELQMLFFEPDPQDPLPGTSHRAALQLFDNAAAFAKQAKAWSQGNYIELPSNYEKVPWSPASRASTTAASGNEEKQDEQQKQQQSYDSNKTLHFFVETLKKWKEIPIELTADDTIWNVKEILEGELGIPPVGQKLIFNGRPVQDDRKIGYYNITDGSKLHFVFAMRA